MSAQGTRAVSIELYGGEVKGLRRVAETAEPDRQVDMPRDKLAVKECP